MRFLIETGNESHTTSWQNCQAKFVGGEKDGQFLYKEKAAIVSQEWPSFIVTVSLLLQYQKQTTT